MRLDEARFEYTFFLEISTYFYSGPSKGHQ